MRRYLILLALPLLAVGCSSSDKSEDAGSKNTSHQTTDPTNASTTTTPTTLPIETVPSTATSKPGANSKDAPTGKILMVKLYVGDLAAGEKFYGNVFGAKLALKVGEGAHIVTLPDGPGLALLKEGRDDKDKYGAFIIQVPDLRAAQALAVANGAKVQGKFAGTPANQVAKSVDLLDPWGNQVEILQIG